MYGHVYKMAEAVVAGARQVAGAEVSLYQVAELAPDGVAEQCLLIISDRKQRHLQVSADFALC